MPDRLVVNKYFLIAHRIASILTTLGLIVVGISGFYTGFQEIHTQVGVQLWVLSGYLVFFALLMLLGHVGRPLFLIKHFYFLSTYLGRGLLEVSVGTTVLLLSNVYHLIPFILGISATATGVIKLFLACPCFSVVQDRELTKQKIDLDYEVEKTNGAQYESVAETVPLRPASPDDDGQDHLLLDQGSAYEPRKPRTFVTQTPSEVLPYQQADSVDPRNQTIKNNNQNQEIQIDLENGKDARQSQGSGGSGSRKFKFINNTNQTKSTTNPFAEVL